MNRSRVVLAFLVLVASALASACSRDALSGPPELRVGRDECGECGMIISEDRCASAILVEVGGRREHVMFDDIGCMLDYEREEREGQATIDGYVRDYGTRGWVRAAEAHFLFADRDLLPTPMGSGIVAFTEGPSAEAKRGEVGGEIMDYPRLGVARRDWMWARYGKPEGAR